MRTYSWSSSNCRSSFSEVVGGQLEFGHLLQVANRLAAFLRRLFERAGLLMAEAEDKPVAPLLERFEATGQAGIVVRQQQVEFEISLLEVAQCQAKQGVNQHKLIRLSKLKQLGARIQSLLCDAAADQSDRQSMGLRGADAVGRLLQLVVQLVEDVLLESAAGK